MPSLFEVEDLIKNILESKAKNKQNLNRQQNKALLERLKVTGDIDLEKTFRDNLAKKYIVDRRQTGETKRKRLEEAGLNERFFANINFNKPTRDENILSSIADRDRKAFDLFNDISRKPSEDIALNLGVSEAQRMAASNREADYSKRIGDLFKIIPPKVKPLKLKAAPLKAPGNLLQPSGRKKVAGQKGIDLFGFYKDANPFIDMSQYLR